MEPTTALLGFFALAIFVAVILATRMPPLKPTEPDLWADVARRQSDALIQSSRVAMQNGINSAFERTMPPAIPPKVVRQYRQGDVLVTPIKAMPDALKLDAAPIPLDGNGKVILAYGEVTGHHHRFGPDRVRRFRPPVNEAGAIMGVDPSVRFLLDIGGKRVKPLRHEEHSEIPVAPGLYETRIQREHVPPTVGQLQANWRSVQD